MRKWSIPFLVLLAGGAGLAVALVRSAFPPDRSPPPTPPRAARIELARPPMRLTSTPHLSVWWDELDPAVRRKTLPPGERSNVGPADYVGPASCKDCHPRNHEGWSSHPHRWMNAVADKETVRGDFSGTASIAYRGGRAAFERNGNDYLMRLERDGRKRVYRITQTIGSRFYQYYVGRQVEGPEPPDHHFYHKDHVLPFGYWLDRREWVPVVHIGPELADDERPDPFAPPDRGRHYAEYAVSCNYCHTTFPLGDLLARRPHQMGEHAPVPMHWSIRGYLEKSHPEEFRTMAGMIESGRAGQNPLADWDARQYAATLGVSCEACHLGAREHAASGGRVPPDFFPASPYLAVEAPQKPDPGRTHDNTNWACGRCHTGTRPTFAAGMSTWNSVEYSDAARGACYSKLRCTDCHDPHQALGPKWSAPPARDDGVCLKCHDQYKAADRRAAHTHHPAGTDGDRCLNCHMPRVNEGLNDVVRTHMIFSPTRPDMIHANQPNACNLCHTGRPIDWTLGHLKDWYGKTYDEQQVSLHYDRGKPVALGWLASPNESVRLVAADAIIRAKDAKALPRVIDALDDPYLLNRQFTAKSLEDVFGLRPKDFGYHFYQTRDERRGPLAALRAKWVPPPGKEP